MRDARLLFVFVGLFECRMPMPEIPIQLNRGVMAPFGI
jgi:hypothetical protein